MVNPGPPPPPRGKRPSTSQGSEDPSSSDRTMPGNWAQGNDDPDYRTWAPNPAGGRQYQEDDAESIAELEARVKAYKQRQKASRGPVAMIVRSIMFRGMNIDTLNEADEQFVFMRTGTLIAGLLIAVGILFFCVILTFFVALL